MSMKEKKEEKGQQGCVKRKGEESNMQLRHKKIAFLGLDCTAVVVFFPPKH